MSKQHFALLCGFVFGTAALHAQQIPDLKIGNESVQFHGFFSQGYAESNENNYLTMRTNGGSFAMTDFAFNASAQLSDKFRIGAQMYDYNVGSLGNWHPTLDWGYADYKFKDWFGVRAGKVKTVIGLYNDTQDANFLYTWALMPQSLYPLDLRATSIAHIGGDFYGHVGLKNAGSIDYTAYYGFVPFDPNGGGAYSAHAGGATLSNLTRRTGGEDIRWNTPFTGLMIGNSVALGNMNSFGSAGPIEFYIRGTGLWANATYADYVHAKWHFSGEFRAVHELDHTSSIAGASITNQSNKAFFAGASYRVAKHLELGTYHSRFFNQSATPQNPNSSHIYDQAVTARIDVTNFWNFKIEGHFMNGYGDIYSAHGFYPASNPSGLKPDTDMVIVRTGVNF